ncbi:MAG: SMP-30/gluconolactonase/LRE family protein [Chloroflexi bacterium]|nr:SMP-30/gluconolactonase/LRE family protein [Chloroflexota bacterium]
MTTALGLIHGNRGPVQTMVIEQGQRDQGEPQQLALVVPGMDAPHPFTPSLSGVSYHGLSADGKWMIYIGQLETTAPDSRISGGLFRTRGLIGDTHQTADGVTSVNLMTTPKNGEWLVYVGRGDLYLSRLNGAERQDVRTLMPSGTWPDLHHGLAISPEGDAVLFTGEGGPSGGGYGGMGHEHTIYRLQVSAGQIENVTDSLGGQINPIAWLDEQNWMVISLGNGLYWKPSEGGDLAPLLGNTENGLQFVEWFRDAGVLMVAGHALSTDAYIEQYYGFRPGEATPIWTASSVNGHFFDITPDENWLIFSREDGRLERMHPDGGGREILTELPNDLQFSPERGGVSPDGQWVLGWRPQSEGGSQVYRVHLASGKLEFLLDTLGMVVGTAWSPDGEWVLVTEVTSADASTPRVNAIDWKTRELKIVTDGRGAARFAGWGPIVGKHWSIGHLLVAVVGLCGVGLIRLPRRKVKNPRV